MVTQFSASCGLKLKSFDRHVNSKSFSDKGCIVTRKLSRNEGYLRSSRESPLDIYLRSFEPQQYLEASVNTKDGLPGSG